jgi:hypothetical protein
MRIADVIRNLQSASTGSRELDAQVAAATGWTKQDDSDPMAWRSPTSQETMQIPPYTTNLQYASELALSISPAKVGGFGWEEGRASAKISPDQPAAEAATPALALCVASLVAYWRNRATR